MTSVHGRMRTREAFREAARDVRSGAARALTFAAAFLLAAGGPALASVLGSLQTIDAARAYVAAGAATYVVKADARIDGRACDSLADDENVRASGAVRTAAVPLHAAALPGTPLPLFTATPGFSAVLGAARAGPGIVVSASVARSLSLSPGDVLETSHGPTPVIAAFDYPDDGRDPLLAFSAIAPTPDDDSRFDACWAQIWPVDEHAVAALGRTVVSGGDGDRALLTQLNPSRGTRFDPGTPWGRTPAALLAAGGGIIVGAISVSRRRLTIASDLHVGVPRIAIATSLVAQTACWVLCGGSAALATIVSAIPLDAADRLPLLLQTSHVLAAAAAAAIGTTALAACLVREKALFRYFKGR
jgi:hypothetical protein